MPGFQNSINNTVIDIAVLGTLPFTPTTQVAINPSINSVGVTTGLLVNPAFSFSVSSGTLYGEQITPQFNPGNSVTYPEVNGLVVAPTITGAGSGTVTNAYCLNITGTDISSNTLTNAYSLYVTDPSGAVNNYTSVLGDDPSTTLVGIGTTMPAVILDVNGNINANRIMVGGSTSNSQLVSLTQGINQGGLGGGNVGTNKTMSANSMAFFDLNVINQGKYWGGVFDGRYVYLIPVDSGTVTRYDTALSFSSALSYTIFDTALVATNSRGFSGGVFDGRYIYFVPNNNGLNGQITRYDTTRSFFVTSSYTIFNTTTVNSYSIGFSGGVYDGRYIYFVPLNNGISNFGQITRYDTASSFTSAISYTTFDTASVDVNSIGFIGGVYDGRYVYLVPNNNQSSGLITRYDTANSFTSAASYTVFDTTSINPNSLGFESGIFDGQYVYFVPNNNQSSGQITRFNTRFSFTSASSYTIFDVAVINSNNVGFVGGVFDNRYIYLIPNKGGSSGQVARYDTSCNFFSTSSYSYFDSNSVNSNSNGFVGGVFDGNYVYLIPNFNNVLTRIDAYSGPLVTVMAANQAPNGFAVSTTETINTYNNLIVGGKVGVNITDPIYTVHIIGTFSHRSTIPTLSPLLGMTAHNQMINIAQGYNQSGFGSGSVGVNKTMNANAGMQTCDISSLIGSGKEFFGGAYDGRFIFFAPTGSSFGQLARYDTMFDWASGSGFVFFDTTTIDANSKGFFGCVYDGRYIYLVPHDTGQVTRYDTVEVFLSNSGYTVFDTATVNSYSRGFEGGIYDNRYVYFVPNTYGYITRFDPTASFTSTDSYTVFDTTILNSYSVGFEGGVYDGRYIYFVPSVYSQITRYDTTQSFTSAASYTIYDISIISTNNVAFSGGVFDGHYIYFIPNNNGLSGQITRYDTNSSFTEINSYTVFDTIAVASNSRGFSGGVFDGRYVYLVPYYNDAYFGQVTRYDTTQSFHSNSSYATFDTAAANSKSVGFQSAVYDGRYVYLVPTVHSVFSRIDSYQGPQATAIAASQAPNGFAIGTFAGMIPPKGNLTVSGNTAVQTNDLQYALNVNGTVNISEQLYVASGLLGSTANNQNINVSEGYNSGSFGSGIAGVNQQMSANSAMAYDLTIVSPLSTGFFGSAFDGRYIYLVPNNNHTSGQITRYDTLLPFSATVSYTIFDTAAVYTTSLGFAGGVFDGRYVYFVPNNNNTSGQITRYDTQGSFTAATSYTIFDTKGINNNSYGFMGGVFDGHYVYFVPNNNNTSGLITRYYTEGSFKSSSSYTCFNTANVHSQSVGFWGGVYDGRYIYLIPSSFGRITRYDTSLSFNSTASYTVFNTATIDVNSVDFNGGVFDGRYLYLVPNNGGTSGQITRYDTRGSFTLSNSYTIFDTTAVHADSKGFSGGIYDGRYVYLIPNNNGINFGQVTRFDTTQAFNLSTSYTVFDTRSVDSNSVGFVGGIFDGKYIYLIPNAQTIFTRIPAYPGSQATTFGANQAPNGFVVGDYAGTAVAPVGGLIVSGRMGIGTSTPQYTLDVNGTISATAISGQSGLQLYATYTTTNNQLLGLAEGNDQGGFNSGSVGTNKKMSDTTTAVFNTQTNVSTYSGNFRGGIFDGRFIYYVPSLTNAGIRSATITRYDTRSSFSSASSYTTFNLNGVNTRCSGFNGGIFDGRYVYFTPQQNNGFVTRYDTTGSFTAVSSYTGFNLVSVHTRSLQFNGGIYDGQYIYFSPWDSSSIITRYDSTLSFNSQASYTVFNQFVFGNNIGQFIGAVSDGRYIYFVPYNSGTSKGVILQYDNSSSFTTISSYTIFDLDTVNANINGTGGACFDGRFIYFVPSAYPSGSNGLVARYDSSRSFTLTASYTTFDLISSVGGGNGYWGAIFDNRYVYFVPFGDTGTAVYHGTVARYDTTMAFNSSSSWTAYKLGTTTGLYGGVFDGRYVFMTSYQGPNSSIVRINGYPGPRVSAITATQAPNGFAIGSYAGTTAVRPNDLIINGFVGINTSNPQYNLHVIGQSAQSFPSSYWGTTSDKRIKQNVQDISKALDVIRQLRPCQFQFHPDYAKDINEDPNTIHYGFIADEVENVLEGCVSQHGVHCYAGQLNDAKISGKSPVPVTELMNLKCLNIHNILIYSIQSIKELSDKGKDLQNQIDAEKLRRSSDT